MKNRQIQNYIKILENIGEIVKEFGLDSVPQAQLIKNKDAICWNSCKSKKFYSAKISVNNIKGKL